MVEQHEPTRWLDDASDAPFELKNVLSSAVNDSGGADALAKLAVKLPTALGAAGGVSGAGASAGTGASTGAVGAGAAAKSAVAGWKIAIWVAGVTVATGASVNLIPMVGGTNRGGEVPAAVIAPAAVELSGTGELEVAAPVETVTLQEELGRAETKEIKEAEKKPSASGKVVLKGEKVLPAATTAPVVEAVTAVTSDGQKEGGADSLSKEAKLLLEAKAGLTKDPEKALKLAEKHHRVFGGEGALSEESDVLQIEALVRLGRMEEAKAAASKFRAEHPQSGHLARVTRLVAK